MSRQETDLQEDSPTVVAWEKQFSSEDKSLAQSLIEASAYPKLGLSTHKGNLPFPQSPSNNFGSSDLVCLSHLRWDFVYQRPQHLLTRFAKERRVFFVEEPIFKEQGNERLEVSKRGNNIYVVVPHLSTESNEENIIAAQTRLLNELLAEYQIQDYMCWYYTPMALNFTSHLQPQVTIYDCMDELSAFKGAPPALKARELELLERAHVVFTGGQSIYEAKQDQHPNIHPFPSSIEQQHFAQARQSLPDPVDQAHIPHPRLGFYGVIDERLDINLLAGLAEARPDWQFVIIGPIVKIDPADLPNYANIHYLGGKSYQELPAYLANWDMAMLPFALNDSTRFISPTKTPEYLAAGKPVISTPIRDVVRPYGQEGLVAIAATVEEFIAAADEAFTKKDIEFSIWLEKVDQFLAQNSWDRTWENMNQLILSSYVERSC